MESKSTNFFSDFEEIKSEDVKTEKAVFEIFKKEDWNVIVPRILDNINKNGNNDEYPYFNAQKGTQYLPNLNVPSEILTKDMLKELHSKLPYYHQFTSWTRVYTISIHGCDMKTFYEKVKNINNSLLVVKDEEGNIFGGYASEELLPSANFYGTGECFLFTFFKGEKKIHVYNSTNENDFYLFGDNNQICFGCSDDNFALCIRDNLLNGYSKSTLTYNNLPLNGKNEKFLVVKLEVWKFGES